VDGMERKRGKLLDLNKLLGEQYDIFRQSGDLSSCRVSICDHARFRYGIASRVSAPNDWHHGASANQAIIRSGEHNGRDGYGILQLGSASPSELLRALAGGDLRGETGF